MSRVHDLMSFRRDPMSPVGVVPVLPHQADVFESRDLPHALEIHVFDDLTGARGFQIGIEAVKINAVSVLTFENIAILARHDVDVPVGVLLDDCIPLHDHSTRGFHYGSRITEHLERRERQKVAADDQGRVEALWADVRSLLERSFPIPSSFNEFSHSALASSFISFTQMTENRCVVTGFFGGVFVHDLHKSEKFPIEDVARWQQIPKSERYLTGNISVTLTRRGARYDVTLNSSWLADVLNVLPEDAAAIVAATSWQSPRSGTNVFQANSDLDGLPRILQTGSRMVADLYARDGLAKRLSVIQDAVKDPRVIATLKDMAEKGATLRDGSIPTRLTFPGTTRGRTLSKSIVQLLIERRWIHIDKDPDDPLRFRAIGTVAPDGRRIAAGDLRSVAEAELEWDER